MVGFKEQKWVIFFSKHSHLHSTQVPFFIETQEFDYRKVDQFAMAGYG
jgi:hypothetical protein